MKDLPYNLKRILRSLFINNLYSIFQSFPVVRVFTTEMFLSSNSIYLRAYSINEKSACPRPSIVISVWIKK